MSIPPFSSPPTKLKETFGTKLRRLANAAQPNDPWSYPYMKAVKPWQPLSGFTYYDSCVNAGNIYTCLTPLGTTSASSPPTQTTGALSSADNNVIWSYWGENIVTSDPSFTMTPWTANTSYAAGVQVLNGQGVYAIIYPQTNTFTVSGVTVSPTAGAVYSNNSTSFIVVSASISGGNGAIVAYAVAAPASSGTLTKVSGTGDATITFASTTAVTISASSGGPTGTSGVIVDGGLVWTYMGIYTVSPYINDFPQVTYTTSNPNPSITPAVYKAYAGSNLSATGVQIRAAGTGYAVGDTINPVTTGATFTTALQLTVTSIGTNGAVTGIAITTPGAYSVLSTAIPLTQNTSSGSGTGATFDMKWTFPGWGLIHGCSLAGNVGPNTWGGMSTFQPLPNVAPVAQCGILEFYSDAPILAFQLSELNNTQGCSVIIDSGSGPRRYSFGALHNVQSGSNANYYIFDFTATSGKKKRHWQIEFTTYPYIPSIMVAYNDSVWAPDNLDSVNAVMFSDSVWATGGLFASYVLSNSNPHRLRHLLGWTSIRNMSQGGTGYINQGAGAGSTTGPFGNRIQEAIALNPDIFMFMGSSNDGGANATNTWVVGSTTTVNTYSPHGLTTGNSVTFSGVTGTGASLINGISLTVTVTSTTQFTLPVNTTALTLTNAVGLFVNTATGNPPVVDVAAADYKAIRTGGSTAPIIVLGLWSASSFNTANSETYLQAAITKAADPLNKTFWIPIYFDPYLPWITGSYNTNPTPFVGVFSATNSNIYVNGTDLFHPIDSGNEYLAKRIANAIRNNVLNTSNAQYII